MMMIDETSRVTLPCEKEAVRNFALGNLQIFPDVMLCVFPGWNRRIMFTAHSGDLPHVLPWPQDAGVHLGPPYTWVTLVVSPAA